MWKEGKKEEKEVGDKERRDWGKEETLKSYILSFFSAC
jgi:hypothetical protein